MPELRVGPGEAPRTAGVVLARFAAAATAQPPNSDSFWEYANAAASEQCFRAAFAGADGDGRLELLTQIASTHSLRRQFAEVHALLDEVARGPGSAGPAPRSRHRLERGRTFDAAGDKASARPLFIAAFDTA